MLVGLLLLPALLLFAAACGDNDDGDDTGTPSVPTATTADGDSEADYPLEPPADAVTTDTGLQYIDLREGTGPSPSSDAAVTVTVHYRGLLPDGTEFDSSYSRGAPAQFQLNGVIPGFAEGIRTMNVGGHRVLYIPGDLGYAEGGNPRAGIGPNQPLVFEVELIASN